MTPHAQKKIKTLINSQSKNNPKTLNPAEALQEIHAETNSKKEVNKAIEFLKKQGLTGLAKAVSNDRE